MTKMMKNLKKMNINLWKLLVVIKNSFNVVIEKACAMAYVIKGKHAKDIKAARLADRNADLISTHIIEIKKAVTI